MFEALEQSLSKLAIHPEPSKSSSAFKKMKKKQAVAESWEDESLSSDTEPESDPADQALSPQQSATYPSAPPPTPISPSTTRSQPSFAAPFGYSIDGVAEARPERTTRPEKTDAVAKRMIAGALGIKAPKKTEEQRAYDRAMKEKVMKQRNQEKEAAAKAKEEAEKAKAAIWSD